jgi:hypothetical protein
MKEKTEKALALPLCVGGGHGGASPHGLIAPCLAGHQLRKWIRSHSPGCLQSTAQKNTSTVLRWLATRDTFKSSPLDATRQMSKSNPPPHHPPLLAFYRSGGTQLILISKKLNRTLSGAPLFAPSDKKREPPLEIRPGAKCVCERAKETRVAQMPHMRTPYTQLLRLWYTLKDLA